MSSNINQFVRPTENADRKDINRILEMIHDLVSPEPEDEGVNERIMLRDHVRVKTNTVTIAGPDLLDSDTKARRNFIMRRRMPETVKSYPLIHTEVIFSGITFPKLDTKFGANINWDNVGYITIDDNTLLKPTDKMTIAGWIRPKSTAGFDWVLSKGVSESYNVFTKASGTNMRWSVFTGAGPTDNILDLDGAPADIWFSSVMTIDSAAREMKLYIDGVQIGGTLTTATGNIHTNTVDLHIGRRSNGGNGATLNSRLAHLFIGNFVADTTWITNYHAGIIDTDGTNVEILTIPFLQSARPKPNATSGLCRST